MNKEVCEKFKNVREWLPHELIEGNNTNIDENLKKYCDKGLCEDSFEKINAGCLYLFDALFGSSQLFNSVAKGNTNIVDYILIWLSYMLNLTKNEESASIEPFYKAYINTDKKYNNKIGNVTAYNSYKDLIDKKEDFISIYVKDMSKFYDAFVLLCYIYIKVNEEGLNCYSFSEIANDFAKKYDELNENYNNGKDSPYNQLLSTLSNDYCNLKNKCNQFPTLPTYSRRFVIKRTLIPIAFMLVALSIFLGIEYKVNNKSIKQYIHH
ncbi:putative yir4 protein [Plasmodium yoelii yoelii]|uniref:Yir4 protein n=1 Tax=Plasmodium yoelii yoelii TaxID=73239 RepID=Q7R7Y8_PLAYO|nr:putative yir4 protein [Plasmodium yoelii yoelii]